MSLRKSPTLTPALLAANRRNSKKSTGPRTGRGKAWSRLNNLQHGGRSQEYIDFLDALLNAPPGRVASAAEALLAAKPVIHPRYEELAEVMVQAEILICAEIQSRRKRGEPGREFVFNVRSRNVVENKQGDKDRALDILECR
jgi:hypothetical protein